MTAIADNSDMAPFPTWVWIALAAIALTAAALRWALHKNAAPAQETPATASGPATKAVRAGFDTWIVPADAWEDR